MKAKKIIQKTTIKDLNDNFLALALLACFSYAIGTMATYLDAEYVRSIAPPEADSVGIPMIGGMYIVTILASIALALFFTIRKQAVEGKADLWTLFKRSGKVRLDIFRWLALALCGAVLCFAVAEFEHINFFADLSYILFFALGIFAALHFFTICVGIAQTKKPKRKPITGREILVRVCKIILALFACLVYIFFIAPWLAILLLSMMMPIGQFFYNP